MPGDERIAALELLRGVAVMGILAANIVGFALPDQAYTNPRAYGGAQGLDFAAWALNFTFVEGKMRGLFSLLFGASLLLIADRARAAGESAASVHYRRMAWLLLFGLFHLYFIWWGDILHHYALIGMIAFLFAGASPQRLVAWALLLFLFGALRLTLFASGASALSAAASVPTADAETVRQWQAVAAAFSPVPGPGVAEDLALHGGSYWAITAHRLADLDMVRKLLRYLGPETLGFMLLGMAGLKSGFLTGAWEPSRYRRWALLLLGVSLPLYALLAWGIAASGFDALSVILLGTLATTPIRPLAVIGLAALIVLFGKRAGPIATRIAAAGRAAFTNYLGASILMTFVFYGYGLGLYGEMSRAALWFPVLAGWAIMLAWSKPWLESFRYGPLEWAWRSLARWRLQPMRRS